MAPPRKSRSVNKRFSNVNEASPDKDVGNSNKSKQRRKLSDKLGSQWSKGELERFYEAYRKYGRDWKKVAAVVRNRSIEMVEALYNMNRAYLSLPEGTASVVGLIAMMTDHYNVLEGSDSERESNDASGIPRKVQKRKRAKVQLSASKEDTLQSQSIASSDGCLSLLKRGRSDGDQPRAVGKRTPRFPVTYSYKKDDRENYIPPFKKGRRSEIDANDDEVAHVAALALTEASQRGGSPQVSQMPYRKTVHRRSSPIQSRHRMIQQPETALAKLRDASIYEDWLEGSIGSRDRENGANARDTNSLMDMEGVGTVEVHQKGKKFYGKKGKVEEIGNNQSDDGGEACSGTEEGLKGSAVKGKDIEVSNTKIENFSPRVQRKRSKKLFFGDESSGLDALHTLADLSSLLLPVSTMESESSVQLKDEKTTLDMDDKSSVPEATSTSHHRDNVKLVGPKETILHTITMVESTASRKSKLGRYSTIDDKPVSELKQQPRSNFNASKRKRKSLAPKISHAEAPVDSHSSKPLESASLTEEENKSMIKGKRTGGQLSAQSKQWKLVRVDGSTTNSDQKRAGNDSAVSSSQVPSVNQVSLPTKRRSRRKMDPQRTVAPKEVKSSENILKIQPNRYSPQDRVICPEEMLSSCLSSYMVRRWCTFEWFYSAIDYPWFAKSEFVEYLNHVGLGHIPKLTRVEWGVFRSSLGKPRRFSERFLHEEREKLKQYRESVRKHYAELHDCIREGLPTDLARPLSVAQRVIAVHPKTREVHDGIILTVDNDKYRVQFDRPEIGVEIIMDIDCMPVNPLDNMPEALRRQNIPVDKFSLISEEPQVDRHSNFSGPMIFASSGHLENASSPMNTLAKQVKGDTHHAISQAKAAATDIVNAQQAICGSVAHIQAREADIRALSELTRALDKKEALLMELRNTNNDILENQNNGESSLKHSEPFKKHLATVLVQLKEASGQASSALLHLRQRNTYPGNPLPPWPRPPTNSGFLGSLDGSFVAQESGSGVVEIVKGSRLKAHTMVDAAIKAMSSMKEGEDAFMRIGEALDSVDKRQLPSDFRVPQITSPEQANGALANQNLVCGASEPLHTSFAAGPKFQDGSENNETQIPAGLITSCVASLFMVQSCTERQYPPADVAQIIESAITSLHPLCPQNLPIYREIQMCMGRIKTQILALIPT